MTRLRLLTAGESHGPALCAILEGLPYGIALEKAFIDRDLARRQGGFGRGGRMKIETDEVEILSGIRHGYTLGSPIAMVVRNRDFANWQEIMAPFGDVPEQSKPLTRPRPGHADLAGALKYQIYDARDVLERASARSTAVRVAAGAILKQFLQALGVELLGHVVRIGQVTASSTTEAPLHELRQISDASSVRCLDPIAAKRMEEEISAAQKEGDSLGGVFEIIVRGLPPGLGSHTEWDHKLDAQLAQALMSIQAIKGFEVGLGMEVGELRGSEVHDPIEYAQKRFSRPSNHAGGIEGGMSNGEPIVLRAAMKPIPTLARPLGSVDLKTKQPFLAQKERTDSCAVPAAAVVGEAVVALVIANAVLHKTGGDSLQEVQRNWQSMQAALDRY